MRELGVPSAVALARNSGQRFIAANSPRPTGCSTRAVKIPVDILRITMPARLKIELAIDDAAEGLGEDVIYGLYKV
jgi:hypothetical protein